MKKNSDPDKGATKGKNRDDAVSQTGKLTESISRVDEKIIDLINQRLLLGKEVHEIQEKGGDSVPERNTEESLLEKISETNKGPLSNKLLKNLFSHIMAETRNLYRPRTIAFLGPEATYTHIAAMSLFGYSAEFLPQTSIRDTFGVVEKGICDYGVVPIENSIEGSVNYTLDLFFESELRISGETFQPISHDLLSKTGKQEDIRIVYSHPQPIGQCRGWLADNLPGIRLEECNSTSLAAKKAAENPDAAAIASSEAARLYSLQVVASRIEDFSRNTTRFLVIGKDEIERTGNDKTSLMFVAAHVPGSLYKVLGPIAEAGINMLKLESRPTKHEKWSYFFFVDLQGHMDDQVVKKTVDKMRSLCLFLKCLGSYPMVKDQA